MSLRRIVVTGSECTGKTTLARALADRFATFWAVEAAREVAERKTGLLGPEDVEAIARAHVRLADEAAEAAAEGGRSLVVLDQDLLSTVVYARHYYGNCPLWIERLAFERRGDLYLLCNPDLPWSADGVRDRPEARADIHALFVDALAVVGARVAEVRGTGDARTAVASEAVASLLGQLRKVPRGGA